MTAASDSLSHLACFLGVVAASSEARADDLVSEVGVALTLGGGVEQFTSGTLRDAVGPIGTWEVRGTIGTRLVLSTELAYLGSSSKVSGGGRASTLTSNGVEVLARVNLNRDGRWRPYVFTGRGLRWYHVADAMPGGDDSDLVVDLPIGAGCMFHGGGLVVDVRASVRAVDDAEIMTVDTGRYEPMHTWSMTARVGYEF